MYFSKGRVYSIPLCIQMHSISLHMTIHRCVMSYHLMMNDWIITSEEYVQVSTMDVLLYENPVEG